MDEGVLVVGSRVEYVVQNKLQLWPFTYNSEVDCKAVHTLLMAPAGRNYVEMME